MTAKDAAAYLNIPVKTLYHLSRIGRIRSIKIGGRLRFDSADVSHYFLYGTENEDITLSEKQIEKRAFPRINCQIECKIKNELTKKKSETKINNISAGGMLVERNSAPVININDPVVLEFYLNHQIDKRFMLRAKIVRIENCHAGIKFRLISPEDKEALKKHVG